MLRRFLSCSLREARGVLSDIQGQTYYNVELVNVSTSEINFTGYRVRTSQTSVLHILPPTIARVHFTIFFPIFIFFYYSRNMGLGKSLVTFSLLRKLITEFWRYLLKVGAKQI